MEHIISWLLEILFYVVMIIGVGFWVYIAFKTPCGNPFPLVVPYISDEDIAREVEEKKMEKEGLVYSKTIIRRNK